jgi:hypothetical protein
MASGRRSLRMVHWIIDLDDRRDHEGEIGAGIDRGCAVRDRMWIRRRHERDRNGGLGGEIELTFDGDHCAYEGATDLAAGPTTLTFVNASDDFAFFHLTRNTGDETAQDVIDYIGEEPSSNMAPPWSSDVVPEAYDYIRSGDTGFSAFHGWIVLSRVQSGLPA